MTTEMTRAPRPIAETQGGAGSPRRLVQFYDAVILLEYVIAGPMAVLLVVVVQEPWALAPLASVLIFTTGALLARRQARHGRVQVAVLLGTAVFVVPALVWAAAGPFSLPMLAVQIVIPPTLAVSYLPRRSTARLLIAVVALAAVITTVATLSPRFGFVDDIPAWFQTACILLGAPFSCALVMQLNWQGHLTLLERSDRLRTSRRQLVATTDAERRRAERDLHDGAQQRLHSAMVQVALARRLLERDPTAAAEVLDSTASEVQATVDELARLARGLLPTTLIEQGLGAALSELAARSTLPVRVECDPGRWPDDIEAAIWFCCAEAVQNATKHGGPSTTVDVVVERHEHEVSLRVTDDGNGFDLAATRATASGQGLTNLMSRITTLGGEAHVDTGPGRGTTVRGVIPVDNGWQHP